MTTQILTRTEIQAMRIRMAAAGVHGWKASDLHRALVEHGFNVHYETIRRIWNDERSDEVPYSLLKAIAEVTDMTVEFVAGDVTTLPDRVKGLYRDHIEMMTSLPLPQAAGF